MDYYEILELESGCTKKEIKKKYRLLCLKYHPDKYDGDDTKFKEIKEAYEYLIDDEKRKLYNIQRIFKNIDFTEYDLQLLQKYQEQFINSNEFKLMKLLYNSIPSSIKQKLWNRFKRRRSKEIILSEKRIDITELNDNIVINLVVSEYDRTNKTLKIIHIITKNGIYYLYLREFNNLILDNVNCTLLINFL